MLKIFNTLTNKKEKFIPIYKDKVGIYVCGTTAYDLCHIGHVRTFVIFDVIIRYLHHLGYSTKYVRNITDIDDKIIDRANKNKETFMFLANRMINEMHTDFATLDIIPPDVEPRVTGYINEIIRMIEILIANNHAYIAKNGDVLFSIESVKEYGILSHQNLKQLRPNINKNNFKNKFNITDFVLWKVSKPNEPKWSSPWGFGRPGWHIECSAMSYKNLGKNFDIHGGGSDLIFPHHENELTQSVCINDVNCANYWIHTGMITHQNKKVSKSQGNFSTIRSILQRFDHESIRYFLLNSHYRSTLEYTENKLIQSRSALEYLYITLRHTDETTSATCGEFFEDCFYKAMNDDFNTAKACSVLFNLACEINRLKNKNSKLVNNMASKLRNLSSILGILKQDPDSFLKKKKFKDFKIKQIEFLIEERTKARKLKEWSKADKLRTKLDKMGIILEDLNTDTTWRYK